MAEDVCGSPFPVDVEEDLLPNLADRLRAAFEDPEAKPEQEDESMATALVKDAVRCRASDVHVDAHPGGVRVRVRIDGSLVEVARFRGIEGDALVNQLRTLAHLDPTPPFAPEEERFSLQLSEDGGRVDLRLEAVPCLGGQKLTLRLLNGLHAPGSVVDLGLHEEDRDRLLRAVDQRAGLFLVTGPTGSGKTTTLYSLARLLAERRRCVVTLEDPVESLVEGTTQVQLDRDRGLDFSRGLSALLRLDADVLMLGEVRERDAAEIAARASFTGRSIMTTLHSHSAVGSVTVLRQAGLRDFEIAVALSMAVGQRLVPRLCEGCRRAEEPDELEAAWIREAGGEPQERLWHPVGCGRCRDTGYVGRVGLFEVWTLESPDRQRILAHASEDELHRGFAERSRQTLLEDGLGKLAAGTTSLEALQRVPDLVRTQESDRAAG